MSELRKQTKDDLVYYVSPQLSVYPRLRHGFFTKQGGVSPAPYDSLNFRFNSEDTTENVLRNFHIAAQTVGSDIHHVARTCQMHTDTVAEVTRVDEFVQMGEGSGVDALITNVPGVVLCGFYADCQLIMLYDHKHKAIGVVHAGWRGIAQEVTRKTIEKMTERYGSNPAEMIAVVGPSICRSCFVTDDDVPEKMREVFGGMVQEYMYQEGEKWRVDLKNITYTMLLRAGILPYNIDISNICTCCGDKSLFWSHRRQGEARGAQAGMITLME